MASVRPSRMEALIRTLLEKAQQSANQATASISFSRPDQAYVEYLLSSEILLEIIPRHKDYPTLNSDREGWRLAYSNLCKQNDKQHKMFKTVYDMIVEDNQRHGTKPNSTLSARTSPRDNQQQTHRVASTSPRPLSMPPTPTSTSRNTDELFIDPSNPPPPPYSSMRREVSPNPASRPTVHPKPQALQGRPRTINGTVRTTSDDSLAERFSQLRVPRNQISNPPIVETQPNRRESSIGTPAPSEYAKPMGPRSMGPPSNQPPPPPKIPLSVPDDSTFPRAPSPAYDPSRAVVSPATSSNNSHRAQVFAPSPQHNGASRPPSSNGSYLQLHYPQDPNEARRSTESLPRVSSEYRHPTAISTDRLYESLRESNVLVIDVRSRADFDQGHIWAKSIICIEPVSLRHGLAAEELEESLVVSPLPEIELFVKRNEFDYVVYYDQQTSTDSFLTGPPNRSNSPALRALHDTLREFNYDKPLRRPPLMLKGGLDAWADLVGTAGLAQSKTAALIGSIHPRGAAAKLGRPIGRVRMASQNSSLEVRKRRMREHKPLNADEEESWLERARNEEVQPAEYQNTQSDNESEEPTSPF
ncbi:MAG: hypothetical protein Q9174_003584, partial [Haloplaca sp. 1 TL-2023]